MQPLSTDALIAIDKRHIWHPYASTDVDPLYAVASATGCTLTLTDGRELIDGMASWWCAIHGYNHPVLNAAVNAQTQAMAHVMFGGLTHAPAASLAQTLVRITPAGLERVFLADSGSVAVEVALKMAVQYWMSQGQPQKSKFFSFKNGYHGDTLGAMSVCDPVTGMHHLFASVLPQNIFLPAPPLGFEHSCQAQYRAELEQHFKRHHHEIAGVILEPVLQGTGGMRVYSPEYVALIRALCDQYHILFIADEIATGFGRTGELFACNHSQTTPDILCVGKALTGGYLTLAATLCTNEIATGICEGEAGVFMHGPTFMGNPLACAVANASIELLLSSDWKNTIQRIEDALHSGLAPARGLPHVRDVRVFGAIGAIEMESAVEISKVIPQFVERGLWVRPFGHLVYVMPPYVISDEHLARLTQGLVEVVGRL